MKGSGRGPSQQQQQQNLGHTTENPLNASFPSESSSFEEDAGPGLSSTGTSRTQFSPQMQQGGPLSSISSSLSETVVSDRIEDLKKASVGGDTPSSLLRHLSMLHSYPASLMTTPPTLQDNPASLEKRQQFLNSLRSSRGDAKAASDSSP